MTEIGKGLPYSLLASMYGAWEEYKVPAVYYHYLLTVLPNIDKKKQILLMSRQVRTLKANTHTYHRIMNVIEAREKSLAIIEKNIHVLTRYENTKAMEWPEDHNLDTEGFTMVHEDSRAPILSPKKQTKNSLIELTNHIKMYQRVTLQIIYMIAQWMQELKQCGYKGLIQFQVNGVNYLSKIDSDANQLIDQYEGIFQNNAFFLMKKSHQKSEYGLIYVNLKPNEETTKKIHECMSILSGYQAEILKIKIKHKANQKFSKRNITKSTDIQKIYMNYNRGNDYIMVKDSQATFREQIPELPKESGKLKKHDLIINPEPYPAVDKTQRKHPVYVNLLEDNNDFSSEDDLLKRSNTEKGLLRKRNNVMVKPVHSKKSIFVETDMDVTKNNGLDVQKKIEMLREVDQQLKYKPKAKKSIPRSQSPDIIEEKQEEKEEEEEGEEEVELTEDNQIALTFDQNIKPTEIVKYLRTKVFAKSQVPFEEIQELAKELIKDKDFVTFIRVESRGLPVAWLAVRFVEKDNTMRRSVVLVYVRKFMKLSNFERKLLDVFVSHGYGLIRNNSQILYEVELLDIVTRPLVRIKYKVNPTVQREQIKATMKKNKCVGQSRILKYHSYSKSTKYHKYCQHERANCQISFNFLQICKITIDKSAYIKARADRITKLGEDMYRITCSINDTDMVIGRTLTDILQLEKESEIEKDSSFDSKYDTDYTHVAIKQNKLMRKYMNEKDQPVVTEFITVSGNIPEVRSITTTKEELPSTLLLVEAPFVLALLTRDDSEAKTVAVVEFQ